MRRVMVVGQPGSGKSTVARALGAATGLPVVHLDRLQWMAGWRERPRPDRDRLMAEAEAGERWVIEGNYSGTWESRLARADLLVWLDRPLGLRLWRVTARLVRHLGRSRPDMADGCAERLGRNTWDFYRWIWQTRRTGRAKTERLAAGAACPVVRLGSDAEVAAFLDAARRPPSERPPSERPPSERPA